jgi:hypothetical protein
MAFERTNGAGRDYEMTGAGHRAASEPGLPTLLALLAGFVAAWTLYFFVMQGQGKFNPDMSEAYA